MTRRATTVIPLVATLSLAASASHWGSSFGSLGTPSWQFSAWSCSKRCLVGLPGNTKKAAGHGRAQNEIGSSFVTCLQDLTTKNGKHWETSPAIFWDLPNGFHHKKRQDTLRLAFCPCRAWGRRASNGFPLQNPGMRWCGMSAQMIKWTSSPKIGSDSFKMFLGC